MNSLIRDFFLRLCWRPPVWWAISPGVIGAIFGAICARGDSEMCGRLRGLLTANSFGGNSFWIFVGIVYVLFRFQDAKRVWVTTRKFSWAQEIGLLLVGGYVVWVANLIFLFVFLAEGT